MEVGEKKQREYKISAMNEYLVVVKKNMNS